MIVQCSTCQRHFDDEFRDTGCPHDTFAANDGYNNFAHHPESHRSKSNDPKRPFARVSDVHEGDILVADTGFECIPAGDRRVVRCNHVRELAIDCTGGGHVLDGQIELDEYVGFYKAT